MIDLLVLRPEPGASATAAAAANLGLSAAVAPLFETACCAWTPPLPGLHDALMLTSANAVRHAGAALAAVANPPVYAVGYATARAARAAGLDVAHVGTGGAAELLAAMLGDGRRRPLHLAGADHHAAAIDGIEVTRHIVYHAVAVDTLTDDAVRALRQGAVALVHSPRAAGLLGSRADVAGLTRGDNAVAAISMAAADALGPGWRRIGVAAAPSDAALLAVARCLCEDRDRRIGRTG